mgnify:CR=1 FL=1
MINEQIRDKEIRLIGEDGEQFKESCQQEKLLKLAAEAELDFGED